MSQKIRVRRIVASLSGEGGPCAGEINADNPTIPACAAALGKAPNYQRIIKEKPSTGDSLFTIFRKMAVAASALIPFVGPIVAVGANAADNAAFDDSGGKVRPLSFPPVTTRSIIGQNSIGVSTPTSRANFGDLFSFLGQVNPSGPSAPAALVSEPGESSGFSLTPGMLLIGSIIAVVLIFTLGRK